MRNDFKKSFDKVKPDAESYIKMHDTIMASRRKRRNNYKYAAIAAALFIVLVVSVTFLISDIRNTELAHNPAPSTEVLQDNTIAYRVVLSINPDVEFSVNESDMIVEVKGLNEDGKKLIEGIDFTGLSLENATIIVVNQLIFEGYISPYSIDREIQLSFSENGSMDALNIMTNIIDAGTSGYDLKSTVQKINETSLSIRFWTDNGENEIPVPADSANKIAFEYELEDEYIGIIETVINDESALGHFIDSCGMEPERATLYYFEELFEKEYIRDGVDIVYEIDNDEILNRVYLLVDKLIKYHGLKLKADKAEGTILCTYSDVDIAPVENKFTLRELLNPMIYKQISDVNQAQMEILKMCFSEDELQYELTPKTYVVVPNLLGLDEEKALYLFNLAKLIPRVVYDEYDPNWSPEDMPQYNENNIGNVIAQDASAGSVWNIDANIMFWILVNEVDEPIEAKESEIYDEIYGDDIYQRLNNIEYCVNMDESTWMYLGEEQVGILRDFLSRLTFVDMDENIDTAPFITTHLNIGYDDNNLIVRMDFVNTQDGAVVILDDRFICYDYETIHEIVNICFDNPEFDNQNTNMKRNIFQMYETNFEFSVGEINRVSFGDAESGTDTEMDLTDDFHYNLVRGLNNIYFAPLDIPTESINSDIEKYYITINDTSGRYSLTIIEWNNAYAAILNLNYISYDSDAINALIESCFVSSPKEQLTYDEILYSFYDMVSSIEYSAPKEIQATYSYFPLEQVRVETWNTNFADIRGYHEADVAYEDIRNILGNILLPSPISAYRTLELIDIEGSFFSGHQFINNTDFRIEIVFDDCFLHVYADHQNLYLRSRINDEWYTALVTNATFNNEGMYTDFISLFTQESVQFNINDLSNTQSISLFYVKDWHKKDYPENGKLSEIVIDDADVIAQMITSLQNNSTPIYPYPSRENADIVFHTPNGDIWAKIKSPFEMDTSENPSECTLIFNGYYWFDNSEFYKILIDEVRD